MGYQLSMESVAPFTHPRPVGHRYGGITFHHWDDPARRPTFEGTVAWLTRPDAGASVHYVAEEGRVARITDPAFRLTWHAGDGATGPGNLTQISVEVNPRWSDGDYATAAELVRDLRREFGDLPLNPHNRWTKTACPGAGDLARIDREARALKEDLMVFTRHPVSVPVITQPWGANRTGGVTPNPNGTAVQQLVYHYGNYQPAGHDGIDYGCPVGTPVYAPGNAVVEYAGWGQDMPKHLADKYGFVYGPGGWASGLLICLAMDGAPIGAYVAHLSEVRVRAGHRVGPATIIGLSGTSGRSGGPHVHFSAIRFPVNYSDPLYSRVNPLPLFSTVTHVPIRPGAVGDPGSPADLMEEVMAFFKDKESFGEWLQQQVVKAPIKSTDGKVWPLHSHFYGITMRQQQLAGRISGLSEAVRQLSEAQGTPLDYAKITAAVEEGVRNANDLTAGEIADAVVDKQAERLTRKDGE